MDSKALIEAAIHEVEMCIRDGEVRAKDGSNIKGVATVVFGDSFKITNIAILENKEKGRAALYRVTEFVGIKKRLLNVRTAVKDMICLLYTSLPAFS